jgi:hypothetical protein
MNLYMPRQYLNPVSQHLVHHAAHQRRHEYHRPDTERDCRYHDYRAAVITPEIAPREHRQNLQL